MYFVVCRKIKQSQAKLSQSMGLLSTPLGLDEGQDTEDLAINYTNGDKSAHSLYSKAFAMLHLFEHKKGMKTVVWLTTTVCTKLTLQLYCISLSDSELQIFIEWYCFVPKNISGGKLWHVPRDAWLLAAVWLPCITSCHSEVKQTVLLCWRVQHSRKWCHYSIW